MGEFFSKDVNFNFIHVLAPKPVDYHYGKNLFLIKDHFLEIKKI